METNIKKLHPLLTLAAITGLIPHSKGSVSEATPVAAAPVTEPAPAAAPVPQPVKRPVVTRHTAPKVAAAEVPAMTPAPMAQTPQVYEAPKPVVKPGLLGTVVAVREVEQKGDAKGVGAVGGGVAGAVLGHNIGDHNKLVTVLGAAGGALLGNHIEKQARATKHWEISVRFDNGTMQTISSDAEPFWHAGDRVRWLDGKLQPV